MGLRKWCLWMMGFASPQGAMVMRFYPPFRDSKVRISFAKTIFAGLIATAGMSLVMLMAPQAGLSPMNISDLLAPVLGGSTVLGWVFQFLFGAALAVLYAAVFLHRLTGPPALRGLVFGLLSWAAEQAIVMPAIGIGFFSGSAELSIGSLFGHLVYGIVLGVRTRKFVGNAGS